MDIFVSVGSGVNDGRRRRLTRARVDRVLENDAGEGIINSQLICLEAGAGFAGDLSASDAPRHFNVFANENETHSSVAASYQSSVRVHLLQHLVLLARRLNESI